MENELIIQLRKMRSNRAYIKKKEKRKIRDVNHEAKREDNEYE